jgi:methylase of polypeptide subunit release factors
MSPVATTRIHEADFCAQVASYSNIIFSSHPEYPFESARIEGFGTGSQKAKRKDLRLYDRSERLILCGEVKLPGTPEGRSPYADDLVRDAHQKADDANVQYFFTWNVNLFVLWDRKKWDVPLLERRVREWRLGQELATPEDAGRPDVLNAIERHFLPSLLADLAEICTGRKTDWAMPPDDIFIRSMESHLDWPIALTRSWMLQQADKSKAFDSKLQEWMAGQDWTFIRNDPQEWYAAIHRAASSLGYLLMNRIIFYKALFDRFEDLPKLDFKPRIRTAAEAYSNLQNLFEKAVKRSGDYEPLFYPHERDWAGTLVFEAPSAIQAWRGVLRAVSDVNFHQVTSDVLGRIFQRLIGPEERHRYGQHFTGDDVVDLINAFCVRSPDATVLDPACGSGSFLVRAYYRKKMQRPGKTHQELLAELFGCDISLYPAHLATLNLAAREINEEANYPRIARRNFLLFHADQEFCRLPDKDKKEIAIRLPKLDAAVANPPYVRQEKIEKKEKEAIQQLVESAWKGLRLSGRSDYHCYFWPAAATLLKEGGYFGFLTSSSWLDVEYGFHLQGWALSNFQLLAVMESNAESWFPDARVKTCVTIMRRCSDEAARMATFVRFVQFKKPLGETIRVPVTEEMERQKAAQRLREEIESTTTDADDERMRIIVKRQSELWEAGVRAGRILADSPVLSVTSNTEDDYEEEAESEASETSSVIPGDYVAGKWGRYVRAPDFYFQVMREFGNKFAPLGELVSVRFGVKSGCDAFFMPHDITQEVLERYKTDREFRHNFGVDRDEVAHGHLKIIKAGDDSVHLIESKFLVPEVHTLRNVHRPIVTSAEQDRVVLMVSDPLAKLEKTYVHRYLKYGETHTFASAKSKAVPVPGRSTCAARENAKQKWYDLTSLARRSFALWPKATQYGHMAPYNPQSLTANCRLYYLAPKPQQEFDELVLTAILNSTLVSFWKSFYGRYTGMEGSLDTEIVDVNLIDVPRPETDRPQLRERLAKAFGAMQTRDIGPMVEETLLECHDLERARRIAEGPLRMPRELTQADRRELDDAVFELLGVSDPRRRKSLVEKLYAETAFHFRWVRVGEIQKMEQRRKSDTKKFSAEELASDLWDAAELEDLNPLREWLAKQRGLTAAAIIPDGSAYLSNHAEMFDAATIYFGKDRKNHIICSSREEAELVKLIADLGVRGTIHIPPAAAECKKLTESIEDRVAVAKSRFRELAQTRTSLEEKQDEVVGLLLRWFVLGR